MWWSSVCLIFFGSVTGWIETDISGWIWLGIIFVGFAATEGLVHELWYTDADKKLAKKQEEERERKEVEAIKREVRAQEAAEEAKNKREAHFQAQYREEQANKRAEKYQQRQKKRPPELPKKAQELVQYSACPKCVRGSIMKKYRTEFDPATGAIESVCEICGHSHYDGA